MQSENRHSAERTTEPLFVADLYPHRSLGRKGFLILMAVLSIACFSSGLTLMVMGAWPVMLFLGLDVLIVWLAFTLNYRAARSREIISVSRDLLQVRKVNPSGRIEDHQFNPFWTRFHVDRHEMIGISRMSLRSRAAELDIGMFLNPDDRESFALAFGNALATVKRA